MDAFLTGGGEDAEGTAASPPPRLFVWVPRRGSAKGDVDDDGGDGGSDGGGSWDVARASTDSFEASNMGAIVFVNSAGAAGSGGSASAGASATALIKSAAQVQCMTISPRIYAEEEEGEGAAGGGEGQKKEKAEGDEGPSGVHPGMATFLSLQMYARHCFGPAVRAIEALDESEEKKSDDGSSAVAIEGPPVEGEAFEKKKKKKSRVLESLEDKIRELDVALGQCRRSALGQIPHVVLSAHPAVAAASAGGLPASGKIDLDALGLGGRLEDDAFLNEVQAGVSGWIGQIRKVTVLPGTTPFPAVSLSDADDPEGGDADLEEVNFWTELEVALRHVRSELAKPEVAVTLQLLKSAKRFLATIALENNTGLEAAEAHATDVAAYLKDYPAQALAAAGDLPRIGEAVDAVFSHLPKVRQSRFYDLERTARLLEATTLTLRRRVAGSLRERHGPNGIVLRLSYERYEAEVRNPTQDVFVRFDDDYDKFSQWMIEQGRRRRAGGAAGSAEKTPKEIVSSMKLYHVVLRDRLDSVHNFRSRHTRLRTVVHEVLMGEASERRGGGGRGHGG